MVDREKVQSQGDEKAVDKKVSYVVKLGWGWWLLIYLVIGGLVYWAIYAYYVHRAANATGGTGQSQSLY